MKPGSLIRDIKSFVYLYNYLTPGFSFLEPTYSLNA